MNITIDDIIIDSLVAGLKVALHDTIDPDEYPVNNVKAGRLYGDPDDLKGLNCLVSRWSAGVGPAEEHEQGRVSLTSHLVGGGSYLQKPFLVHLILRLPFKNQDTARRAASLIIARTTNYLQSIGLSTPLPRHPTTNQPQDDFGEGIVMKEISGQKTAERGVPGNFSWEAETTIDFFTFKP